eukprot:TRINITY_DN14306_c0_g1_i1.p1 TRINITY_DN14306_c0_g1~~TRINITY_DN14306_c0_g1_i1.p1  ORF type:complete len:784 (+),score=121.76 TRINITY_DN14306_c0_g1_i1:77-2428(+)
MSSPSVPQASTSSASHEPELPGEPDSDKVYLGVVKSYNDRRGFGFVACAETAAEFGRDVYMSKLEAQLAAAGISISAGENLQKAVDLLNQKMASLADKNRTEKPGNLLKLAEEDIVRFMVKLSVEGFPQAVRVQRLQKFQGSIFRSAERDLGCADSHWTSGTISSHEVASKFGGKGEVVLHQQACGQVKLVPGDKVTFCIPQELDTDAHSEALEAKLVMLASTARPAGSVLGCCHLQLPRPAGEGQSSPPPLSLDCHALGNKVILSGLPMDVVENELMRFFSKQGATKAIVAHARCCSFASINFPNTSEVCTLLSRSTHAFADEKETRIATIQDRRQGNSSSQDEARLPALPAPALSPGQEAASITITWAPLQLAVAYLVEMRPAGTKEAWAAVDTGTTNENEAGRFGADCSSCSVSGLRPGFAYEARISYFSSCGCRSEASEASSAVTPGSQRQSVSLEPMTPPHHAAYHQRPIWSVEHPAVGYCRQAPAPWRCAHGTVVPPPPPPEILAGDEAGFSVAVRWPSVGQASAYVVELREAGSSAAERFVRSAEAVTLGSLVELRVGGLRPIPGRSYMAQVRAVAHCGCESAPSAEGYSPPIGCGMMFEGAMSATGPGMLATTGSGVPPPPNWRPVPGGQPPVQPQGAPLHIPQAAPLHVPAGFAYGASGWPYSGPLPDASPISIPLAPSFSPEGAQQQGTAEARLAAAVREESPELQVHSVHPVPATPLGELPMTALAPGAPLTLPPEGPPAGMRKLESAFEKVAAHKELPPEVTGQEECLILD